MMADDVRTYNGRKGKRRIEQPTWMKTIRVGDVVTNGGAFRVVREVTRWSDGTLHSVKCVIRHCSWTHRCYTILDATQLRLLGYRRVPLKRRLPLQDRISKAVKAALHERGDVCSVSCCDVEGMP